MKKTIRRSFAIVITLLMLIAMIPGQVFAADNNQTVKLSSGLLVESPRSEPNKLRAVDRSGCTAIEAFPGLADGTYFPGLGIYTRSVATPALSMHVPQNILDSLGPPTPGRYTGWWIKTQFMTPPNTTYVRVYMNENYIGQFAASGDTSYTFGHQYTATPSNGDCSMKLEAQTTSGTRLIGTAHVYTYN